jgi:hypothetical protein
MSFEQKESERVCTMFSLFFTKVRPILFKKKNKLTNKLPLSFLEEKIKRVIGERLERNELII